MDSTQQLLKILENPDVFNINRLKAHSDYRYYATLEKAKAQGPMSWRQSLNGIWKFNYSQNQPVYISFQGVETAINPWCNGKFVGYSEDSFTPSEFDLTP